MSHYLNCYGRPFPRMLVAALRAKKYGKKIEDKMHLLEIDQQFLQREDELSTPRNEPPTADITELKEMQMRSRFFLLRVSIQSPREGAGNLAIQYAATQLSSASTSIYAMAHTLPAKNQQPAAMPHAVWPSTKRKTFSIFCI